MLNALEQFLAQTAGQQLLHYCYNYYYYYSFIKGIQFSKMI